MVLDRSGVCVDISLLPLPNGRAKWQKDKPCREDRESEVYGADCDVVCHTFNLPTP